MKTLFVFDNSIIPEKIRPGGFSSDDKVWLFPLTSRSSLTSRIRDIMEAAGAEVETVCTGTLLNNRSDKIREEYIRFVAELPQKVKTGKGDLKEWFSVDKDTSLWWFSLIAEKSICKSEAFNALAQLDSIVNTITEKEIGSVMFACGSGRLTNALLEYSRKNYIAFKTMPTVFAGGLERRIRGLQRMFCLKHFAILLCYAIRSLFTSWRVKRRLASSDHVRSMDNPLMAITHYPNIDLSLARRGIFRDKYYSFLQEGTESNGREMIWVAMYARRSSVPFVEALGYVERFIKNGYHIFFLEEFCSFRDHVRTFLTILASGIKFLRIEKDIRDVHTFGNYNFYSLFRDDWYSSFAGLAGYAGVLYYNAFRSMLSRTKAEKCVYLCEMAEWEKALICAKKATGSGMSLYGYQHGTVSRMLLNYFNDPCEITGSGPYIMPQPDKIICNGRLPHDYMKESGWSEEKLSMVEALRYNHLKKALGTKWNKKKDVILLAFSISAEESSAILTVACEAFKDAYDREIWIKPHPFLDLKKVFKLAGISPEDLPFQFKEGPIENFLADTRVVISGESGVTIEALAFGCEVVIVNVPERINMSPLRYVKTNMVSLAGSPEELKQVVDDVFERRYEPAMHAAEAGRIINDFFCLDEGSNIPSRFLKLLGEEKGGIQ